MYIVDNLQNRFEQTAAFQEKRGRLHSEFNAQLFSHEFRRPDLGYLTREQLVAAADKTTPLLPAFVIEIISESDNYRESVRKIRAYLRAGVQVVWHVIPDEELVIIVRPGLETLFCTGTDNCSAAPALPDFNITVEDIFRKA